METFQGTSLKSVSNDDFGAATSDVDDETASRFARHCLHDTQIDQARLFNTGDDFNGMGECGFRAPQELPGIAGLAQGIGAHSAHLAGDRQRYLGQRRPVPEHIRSPVDQCPRPRIPLQRLQAVELPEGDALVVEKGSARRRVAGPEGIRYLTARLRRGGLELKRFG